MAKIMNVARVNYEIPDELHRQAKAAASIDGVNLREFVVQALRNEVSRVEREHHVRLVGASPDQLPEVPDETDQDRET